MTAKVSIIIPVFNVENYVKKCLESVTNQTMKDIEIIVVDDCGTDNSMNIVRDFAQHDKRIKIISQKKNNGNSFARNLGLKHASAPYIMFCDSDDLYQPTMCEKMYNAISGGGVDVAVCGATVQTLDGIKLPKGYSSEYQINFNGKRIVGEDQIQDIPSVLWNKIYRRDLIDKIDWHIPESIKNGEDVAAWVAYSCLVHTVFFVPENLYTYNKHIGSITADCFQKKVTQYAELIQGMDWLYDFMQQHDLYLTHYGIYQKMLHNAFFYAINAKGVTKTDREKTYQRLECLLNKIGQNEFSPQELANISHRSAHSFKLNLLLFLIKRSTNNTIIFLLGKIKLFVIRRKPNKDILRLFGLIPLWIHKKE